MTETVEKKEENKMAAAAAARGWGRLTISSGEVGERVVALLTVHDILEEGKGKKLNQSFIIITS